MRSMAAPRACRRCRSPTSSRTAPTALRGCVRDASRSRRCGRGCRVRSTRSSISPDRRRCCRRSATICGRAAFLRRRFTLTPGNSEPLASVGFWRDRPVFVTGATGLLGGWLVRHLVQAGADVVCLVRDWVPQSELVAAGLIDRVRVARGDVRDQETLERVLGEYEIATVLHLAAQTIVGV